MTEHEYEIKTVLERQSLDPIVTHTWLLKHYGDVYLDWEPEALWRTVALDFHASLPRYNKDLIQAVRLIHKNNNFLHDWFMFEKILLGLNALPVIFDIIFPPTLGPLSFGIKALIEFNKFRPNTEVEYYILATLLHQGITKLPKSFGYLHDLLEAAQLGGVINNDKIKKAEEYLQHKNQLRVIQAKVLT